MREINEKESEFCKAEEIAFHADNSDANRIAVLCKRDEFNRIMLRQQQAEIEALKALNKSIMDDPLQFIRIKAQEK